MDFTDKPTKIRQGEELDRGKIKAYLKTALPGVQGPISIQQFPGGYSNLTYLVTVGNQEYVLRRPPFGTKAKTAHDMAREYKVLSALGPLFRYCPKPITYCDDLSIIGSPFYIMERLPGIILRRDLPPGMVLSPHQARRLSEEFVDVLVSLHAVDYRKAGLGNFGKPEGYVQRQVSGWSERYRAARTDDAPDFEKVMAWISEKMPPDSPVPTVVHNDYQFANVVLDPVDPTKIIGILDWEMATIGDPLMDLGNTLAYWVQGNDPPELFALRARPTDLEGMLTRAELVGRYEEKSGKAIRNLDFYYCFGLFRLAVIGQQIYYRYYHGQTKDERFKMLVFYVSLLEKATLWVMEGSGL